MTLAAARGFVFIKTPRQKCTYTPQDYSRVAGHKSRSGNVQVTNISDNSKAVLITHVPINDTLKKQRPTPLGDDVNAKDLNYPQISAARQ